MVSGILHEPGGISSRFLARALLLYSVIAPAHASPLFDEDSLLELQLRGPLKTMVRDKKKEDLDEYPFILKVGSVEIPVNVRVRGASRRVVCEFPPLRLNFSAESTRQTVFHGQDKLKLVTHCKSDSDQYQNNLLEEYTAYRIFNVVSDAGYRVRLLRIRYVDTDEKLKNLDRAYYAFLIEPDRELAARLGANMSELPGVPYSRLDADQTARLYVFQYLIGNFDWSFVSPENKPNCCHNVDLLERNGDLLPIPYDFDRSGLVNAKYAKPPKGIGIRRVTQRVYRGYCKVDIEKVAAALDETVRLRNDIMSVVANSPFVGDKGLATRIDYIAEFFERALGERDEVLKEFGNDCIGPD